MNKVIFKTILKNITKINNITYFYMYCNFICTLYIITIKYSYF